MFIKQYWKRKIFISRFFGRGKFWKWIFEMFRNLARFNFNISKFETFCNFDGKKLLIQKFKSLTGLALKLIAMKSKKIFAVRLYNKIFKLFFSWIAWLISAISCERGQLIFELGNQFMYKKYTNKAELKSNYSSNLNSVRKSETTSSLFWVKTKDFLL